MILPSKPSMVMCVALLACLASLEQPIAAAQEMGEWLHGIECKPDERRAIGLLPECEPTCENPRPICQRVFLMDAIQCFCKAPLVRDTRTKRCIRLGECPSGQQAPSV